MIACQGTLQIGAVTSGEGTPFFVSDETKQSEKRSQKPGGGDCLTKTQGHAKTSKSKYMV